MISRKMGATSPGLGRRPLDGVGVQFGVGTFASGLTGTLL